mmetsp:Transcript_18521/g.16406  ORF Transcript_18521/g.16406 Transcript_18521/m.16406 type:complete len:129 (-) Transcript_18521:25-411(-)
MGMSIWGKRAESPFFCLLPKLLKKHGIKLPKSRSYFHLEGKAIDMVKNTGFKNIKNVQKKIYFNLSNKEAFGVLLDSPFYKSIFEDTTTYSQETLNKVIEDFHDIFDKEFTRTTDMVHFETDIIIAQK